MPGGSALAAFVLLGPPTTQKPNSTTSQSLAAMFSSAPQMESIGGFNGALARPIRPCCRKKDQPSDACSPEGYQFALDAFLLLRIHVDLVIQHHCDAGEPANGEGGIFEIGGKSLVACAAFA
jgi:hypothetical protein